MSIRKMKFKCEGLSEDLPEILLNVLGLHRSVAAIQFYVPTPAK